jgi:hypothetical protein
LLHDFSGVAPNKHRKHQKVGSSYISRVFKILNIKKDANSVVGVYRNWVFALANFTFQTLSIAEKDSMIRESK